MQGRVAYHHAVEFVGGGFPFEGFRFVLLDQSDNVCE